MCVIYYIKNCVKFHHFVFSSNDCPKGGKQNGGRCDGFSFSRTGSLTRRVSERMHPAISLESYWRNFQPIAGPWWYRVTVSVYNFNYPITLQIDFHILTVKTCGNFSLCFCKVGPSLL
jgi:hypothetical protein